MASSLRTRVEQDMSKHTLEHIHTKLTGRLSYRTTFVVVEGSDDLAFYRKFLDICTTAPYYATKIDASGSVVDGGCEELQHIVRTILEEGRTDKIIGIMDTDSRKYLKGYKYPKNIFNTDHRDMEMTALSTPSVQQALRNWITDFDNCFNDITVMLRHSGVLRIVNDKYRLGCNFRKKVKINCIFNTKVQRVYKLWRIRYDYRFLKSCLKKKNQSFMGLMDTITRLFCAFAHQVIHSYKHESDYDICQGHDTLHLLSLCLVNTAKYSKDNIWQQCFDAYSLNEFKNTKLYDSLHTWEMEKGVKVLLRNVRRV